MSTVTAGNPVTLDARFCLDGQESPTDVIFHVLMPDNSEVEYRLGVDAEVTNPAPDYYECELGALHEVFEYRWNATGYDGSSETETIYGTVFVIPAANDPEQIFPPGPNLGPALTWITGEDVAACAAFEYGSSAAIFDSVAYQASMALYEISGRRFTGLQTALNRRPCRNNCGCWLSGPPSYGMGSFWWTGTPWGVGGGWAWYNERGDRFGCSPMSVVKLAGYPVRRILEVKIDGTVMPEFDGVTGFRNWMLDGYWRNLIRMDEPPVAPSVDATPRFWPGCQNMSLDPDQPGTFAVSYEWGIDPPELGRAAAVEIALQLFLACSGRPCVLPTNATKIVRQEITVERGPLMNWFNRSLGTGLVAVDLFLQAYNNGQRGGRKSAVWSPDVQAFARKGLGV